jgi:hypothetical protein
MDDAFLLKKLFLLAGLHLHPFYVMVVSINIFIR